MGEPARRKSTRLGKAYEIDGDMYPSVTTVLKQLSAPALTTWRMKQVAQAAVDLHEWRDMPVDAALQMLMAAGNAFGQRAAAQGTEIHEMIEQGQVIEEAREAVQPYLMAALMVEQHIGDPIAAERTVVNMHRGYAGTADLFYQAEGGLGVLDWKSKADPDKTAGWSNDAMQLAALAACDMWVDRAGELYPMEDEVVELTIAAIKADGSADVRTISKPGTISQLQEAFYGLVEVHKVIEAHPYWLGIWDESMELGGSE